MTNEISNPCNCIENEAHPRAEKSRRDRLSAVFWGCILLWAGLVFLAESLGLLAGLGAAASGTDGSGLGRLDAAWSLIFLGTGAVFLVAALVRWLSPAYRRPAGGNLFIAAICLGIGVGDLFDWVYVWPLLLLALGIFFLARGTLVGNSR